jgi:ribonucleoside-diphosphate reductase alpha chain
MKENIKKETYSRKQVIDACTDYFKGDVMAAEVWANKYALKDKDGNIYELTPDDMHRRLAKEFARIESHYQNPISEEEIFDLLKNFKYIIPQGSPMAGIGNNFQFTSLSNCFVIGNDADSYGGILKLDQELVQLQKRRAGVGLDLSFVRPEGSTVLNSAMTSTGVVPFMQRYSNSTREVAQDGRRGALMETISIIHPDSEKFIDAKMQEGKVTGANISVKITDFFMEAALNGEKFIQQYPVDSKNPVYKKEIDAKNLWKKIIHNAWDKAEPGLLFWDTILRESLPDCYADLGFKTVSTNPCGEIFLCPGDSCRLLSVNLYSYVINPFTKNAYFDFELFSSHVNIAQRMMDDMIDLELEKINSILSKIESDPEPENIKRTEKELWLQIKDKAEQGRRCGFGITAEGDMLAALGLTYGNDDAIDFSEKVHKTLKLEAYRSSVNLAKERGTFEIWDASREVNNPFANRIKQEDEALYNDMMIYGRRNIALLTIAPTGTVSMMTQTTSGIEPVFFPSYKRRRKINPQEKNPKIDFRDKQGDAWQEYQVFHLQFEKWLEVNGYDIEEVKLMSASEVDEIIKKSPYYKATSADVDWIRKVEMQGRIQKHVDHSISVTVNLPSDVSEELVAKVYETGWKVGCKGLTVYRNGCRDGVLISGKEENEAKTVVENNATKRPKVVNADVFTFQNNYEKWIAIVGKVVPFEGHEEIPYELFTGRLESFQIPSYVEKGQVIKRKVKNTEGKDVSVYDFKYIDKDGYPVEMAGLSRSFNEEYWNYAKLISAILRHRMPMVYVLNVIDGLKLQGDSLNTWKSGVERVLRKYIVNGTESHDTCEFCGAKLIYVEGCLKCSGCGQYSKCG